MNNILVSILPLLIAPAILAAVLLGIAKEETKTY